MNQFRLWVLIFLLIPGVLLAQTSADFDDYFVDKTMRVDYFHIGDAKREFIALDQIYQQGIWAGSQKNVIDNFNNGRYFIKVYDSQTNKLIFSKGFDSYFGEYKTTAKALNGIMKAYHESALFPYPKNKVKFTLEVRNRENNLHPFFSKEIDPSSVDIIKEGLDKEVKVFEILKNGAPHEKLDIAFIAEGYTSEEVEKVKKDLKRFTEVFFAMEPYKSHRNSFNIYGVFKPSPESGCDEPRHGVFKKTSLSATFNSLGSERYLLTEDNKALRDVAAHVPYDALFIMINHKRYGGGGIYNFYCTFTVDNQWYKYLFLHEFGHSFAGLADEYYTSSVAYNEFYPRGIEPVEPNITALLDPDEIKWRNHLSPGIKVPTPWEKEKFDKMDMAYQKIRKEINDKIARLKREGASQKSIDEIEQESERLSRDHALKIDAYLAKSKFAGRVGAFEGAGYSSEGLYRPMVDCLMFTKGDKPFCKVCEKAVVRMIKYYTE